MQNQSLEAPALSHLEEIITKNCWNKGLISLICHLYPTYISLNTNEHKFINLSIPQAKRSTGFNWKETDTQTTCMWIWNVVQCLTMKATLTLRRRRSMRILGNYLINLWKVKHWRVDSRGKLRVDTQKPKRQPLEGAGHEGDQQKSSQTEI